MWLVWLVACLGTYNRFVGEKKKGYRITDSLLRVKNLHGLVFVVDI